MNEKEEKSVENDVQSCAKLLRTTKKLRKDYESSLLNKESRNNKQFEMQTQNKLTLLNDKLALIEKDKIKSIDISVNENVDLKKNWKNLDILMRKMIMMQFSQGSQKLQSQESLPQE